MARHKKYEDEDLKKALEEYWDTECLHDPRKLSYVGLARFMQKAGIDYDDNALKHRPVIVEAVKRLKAGGSLKAAAPAPREENSVEYEALLQQNKALLDLFMETFAEQLCAKLLMDFDVVQKEDLSLNPGVAEKAILTADSDIFENSFVKRLAKEAALFEEEKERKVDGYGGEEG